MRQIQDLTLNKKRERQLVSMKLRERKRKFCENFKVLTTPNEALGLRATGIPNSYEFSVDDLFKNSDIDPEIAIPNLDIRREEGRCKPAFNTLTGQLHNSFRRILNGARIDNICVETTRYFGYGEVYRDGLVELAALDAASMYETPLFDPDWATGLLAHLLMWIDRVRKKISHPNLKYTIQVELCVRGIEVFLCKKQDPGLSQEIPLTSYVFREYSFNDTEHEVRDLLEHFQGDLFKLVGQHCPERYEISSVSEIQPKKLS
ncbi:MAG: hypothetical protein OXO49_03135 [Gammaproteobacteria bacterium]|nr:hypothetical protein [Gammaproteobacteria bacterium]MDE0251973.1 hypothetical protein [Gammaproteobacteria bacterium]MDE0402919.1 hypothetical protein [Gammaproteobacteria bacterium]